MARTRAQDRQRPRSNSQGSYTNAVDARRLGVRREVFSSQQIDRTEVETDKNRARRWKILLWVAVVLVFLLMDLLVGVITMVIGKFTGHGPQSLLPAMLDPIGPWWLAAVVVIGVPAIAGLFLSLLMRRQLAAQAAMNSVDDINQHAGDGRLATPAELVLRYQWFPDCGTHASIDFASIISHVLIDSSDRGLSRVVMADGQPVQVDGELGRQLLATSGLEPEVVDEVMAHRRQRLGSDPELAPVRKQIAATWSHPDYEPARPAGAYLVDTAPANTTVLGTTRAGKGQTLIEPWLDAQTRSAEPSNLVVNDPKGELVARFYGPATARGFDVVQFNLINPPKTDRYNPLGMAAMAARAGEYTKCAAYIQSITATFFPPGGQDPFWNNAASSATARCCYALIDMLLEREREIDARAARERWTPSRKAAALDTLWASATLYNAYQMFITLSSIAVDRPKVRADRFTATLKDVTGDSHDDAFSPQQEAKDRLAALVEAEDETLWAGYSEQTMDGLSLYFRAMRHLPVSEIRQLAINEDASLRAMGGSERTISSVYGIALAAMNYFSDPTVKMLTSGPPSETVDIAGLSFPRRLAVRLDPAYVRNRAMGGSQARWTAYSDPLFSEPLGEHVTFECADTRCAAKTGKVTGPWPEDGLCPACQAAMVDMVAPDPEFSHTDTLTQNGWAYFYLRGMFPADATYVLLEVISQTAGTTVETLRFRFDKGYRHADRGRTIVTKPLTGERIVRDGLLTEIAVGGQARTSVYDQELVAKRDGHARLEEVATPIVRSTSVRYSQSPKALFMITPPHLDKYARLLLVLLRDMVDLNFEAAYMTRTNQQPDLGTKFMLDEVGNLKSEGNGLRGFETLLSIGLGQRQQFHLVLQSLQQLTEIYGGSVESILQSNTANLIFLKSTDTELIERLSKMSGQRHVAYRGSKTVTKDMEDLLQFKAVEGRVSYTMALDTENVILANDLTYLPPRNWVVLRSGEYPIWNRDETIMPMAYALLAKQPPVGAPQFSLQNLPSLSNAGAYDPRKDTPNFESALQRICAQALVSEQSKTEYQEVADIGEDEITYMDPDFYAEQVMSLIQTNVAGRPSLDETIAELRKEFAPWVIGATAPVHTTTTSAAGGAASERLMGDAASTESAAGATSSTASSQDPDKPRGGPALIVDDDEGFPLDFDEYDDPGY